MIALTVIECQSSNQKPCSKNWMVKCSKASGPIDLLLILFLMLKLTDHLSVRDEELLFLYVLYVVDIFCVRLFFSR